MARRPENARALALLETVDADLFRDARCWFAGGTAISLRCDEFRVSRDIDFLCSSREGYRRLRQRVFDQGERGLFRREVAIAREFRADRYGIRFAVEVEGVPLKVEIVSEGRIDLEGIEDPTLPVPRLSDEDLVGEKFLANQDRYLDDAALGRDAFDLILLEHTLGRLPESALEKARAAYGSSVDVAWNKALERMKRRPRIRERWFELLGIDATARDIIEDRLESVPMEDEDR